jgi:hypothetical protein
MKTFKTLKVWKNSDKKEVIQTGLTESQAQQAVNEDLVINPKAEVYMLIYSAEI